MRTDFNPPPHGKKIHDYNADSRKFRGHLNGMIRQKPHPGQAQHMGGVASLVNYMDAMHRGESHAVLKELKEAMDYLVHFRLTGDHIHKFFAGLEFERAKELLEEIHCKDEKARAQYYIDCVHEYMQSMIGGSGGTHGHTRAAVNL